MKNKKIFLVVIIFLLISMIIILNKNIIIKNKKEVVKEMSESTQVSDLQTQINTLNASHDEYAKNVQAYKEKIAEAITNQGVSTSADAKAEVMAENIGKILQAKTTATATAAQILKGQTAWVNGNKVTGTMVNRGALNWNPTSSTTKTIAAGYYSGGTLNSSGAYNAGVTAADNRVNVNSVNYKTGYNNGYNKGKANFKITNIVLSSTGSVLSGSKSHGANGTYEMTFDVTSCSKITFGTISLIAGQSGVYSTLVVTLDGTAVSCTSGTVLDVSNKSTMKISLNASAHGWANIEEWEDGASYTGKCTISYIQFA